MHRYPDGFLSQEDLQYELRIPKDDIARSLFEILMMQQQQQQQDGGQSPAGVALETVALWKRPSFHYENAIEMLLGTWDYDKDGDLVKGQIIPVVVSMINAGFLKPQEGAEYVAKNIEDFPPNWKEPHNEEVLAWPLAFDINDVKEKRRAAEQVVEELLVLHGMQFEGEGMEGELSDLHFEASLRYLAARCGFEDAEEFRADFLKWIAEKILEDDAQRKDTEDTEEARKKPSFSAFSFLGPGQARPSTR